MQKIPYIFGYIAGRFDTYSHPDTKTVINEAATLRSSPDCVFLKADEIEAAYKKEEGFNDLASFKKWLLEKLGEKASVIIVEGDF